MTDKQRNWLKHGLIIVLLLALVAASFQPVKPDLLAITPTSQAMLTGQVTEDKAEASHNETQAVTEQAVEQATDENVENQETNEPASEGQLEQQPRESQLPEQTAAPTALATKPVDATQQPPVQEQAASVEVVEQANNTDAFFTTNLVDGLIVTEPNYVVTVQHLRNDLTVEDMRVQLNGTTIEAFQGELTFEEGQNQVALTVFYLDEQQQQLNVQQTFEVTLNTEETVIYTTAISEQVTAAAYRFTAWASKEGQAVPLRVTHNEQSISPQAGNGYVVTLQAGKNELHFSADGAASQAVSIIYEPPVAMLRFDTDLVNQKVNTANFTFYAKAYADDEPIAYRAALNGEPLPHSEPFTVTLEKGTNVISLQAEHNGEQLAKQYQILYTDPNAAVVAEEDPLAPIIKTDLVTGTAVKGLIKTINVWPTTADGTRIRGKDVAVKVNGIGVPFVWDDAEKTSYKLSLQDGVNTVEIRVWDADGRVTKETYDITAKNMENEIIGQATVSVEASVLGIPYVIPPVKVDIYQGQKGSFIIDQLLRNHGFTYDHTGTLQNNFYLSTLYKENMLANVQIDDELWALVEANSTRANRDEFDRHSLGEFDFANGAGWMYSINGDYPNYGFADAYFLDGDVIRIRFTLHYGKDINGYNSVGSAQGNWNKEW